MTLTGRRIQLAAALDVVAILVFVAIGRRSHDETDGFVTGTAKVAAPFLIALAAGWLVARAWRRPTELSTGVVVWLVTAALGLVLRRTLFDRGTALAFIIVTTLTTAVLLLGWRAIVNARSRRVGKRQPAGEATRTRG